jgi:hypothetical protein
MSVPQVPLNDVEELSPQMIDTLRRFGIHTVEESVANATTAGTDRALAEQLQITPAELTDLVNAGKQHLPPARAADMTTPVDPSAFPRGARPDRLT